MEKTRIAGLNVWLDCSTHFSERLPAYRAGDAGGPDLIVRSELSKHLEQIDGTVLAETAHNRVIRTADGRLCAFANEPSDPLNYNDNGEAIYACWRTPDLSGRTFYRNKTFSRFYVALASALATGVRAWGRVAGIWEELFSDFVTARYFSYAHLIYSKFTYSNDDTPRTLGDKIRLKKVDKAGFKVEKAGAQAPGAASGQAGFPRAGRRAERAVRAGQHRH